MNIPSLVNKENAFVIDVREVSEFIEGHIDTAVNMPLSRFDDFLNEIKEMNGPKIFYCRSGNRSDQAVKHLTDLGITESYNGGSLSDMITYLNPDQTV